ncbi:MAG: hypothetical protein CVU77_06765 [Elusimicrobia bacterium HGW-Elusimicrobia-1]|jgi:uncharacterized 2Fe-2S/4Fe-4S cluster protein (DUF4445 family)|nr:MAG: hypothetical protein CVU77_06765 [Elusimicrobia bacterium HGW-Elusimicrobia-1]
MPKLKILPYNKTILADEGVTLLDALRAGGVYLNARCGGAGTCGRCMVKIGGRSVLSCRAKTTSADLEIFVPELSRLEEIYSESRPLLGPRREYPDSPSVEKIFVSTTDIAVNSSGEWEKLSAILCARTNVRNIAVPLDLLRKISEPLAASSGRTFSVFRDSPPEAARVLGVADGDTSSRNYGIAVDVGTTTVAVALIDLKKSAVIDAKVTYNRQITHGEDVITRMIYASTPDGLDVLSHLAAAAINDLVSSLLYCARLAPDDISAVAVAGNTAMAHILYKINPARVRLEPFAPVAQFFPTVSPSRLGLQINPDAALFAAPCVSAYVGGDISAGLLATDMLTAEKLCLLVDAGTNGEIVLGNSEFLVCAATSAGPAFEGVGIKSGMHAIDGAVNKVFSDGGRLAYTTINSAKPKGICGTGLIDLLCELLAVGAMNRSGKLDPSFAGVRKYDDETGSGLEFLLVKADESSAGEDIVITETDIENLIRSKGAVFMGIMALLKATGYAPSDIDKIYVSGGFGNSLDAAKAVAIGMFPDLPTEKYKFIGNSSLAGAARMLVSSAARRAVDEAARKMTYIDLGADPYFMNEYTAALFFPHTDEGLFPSAKKYLAAARGEKK